MRWRAPEPAIGGAALLRPMATTCDEGTDAFQRLAKAITQRDADSLAHVLEPTSAPAGAGLRGWRPTHDSCGGRIDRSRCDVLATHLARALGLRQPTAWVAWA